MSLSVIDKYVAKKEKDLLEYAKILESIITLEENNMWKNKKEFSIYAKEVIGFYTRDYYFDNNKHRDNPIEYSNDNINFVLRSIIEYFKKNELMPRLKEWKNETFLLSVIICTSCYVDIATNVVDGDFQDTKGKFKYLLNYFKKTKILKVSDNKYWVNDLFNALKKNTLEDKKFLDCFEDGSCHNEYKVYTNNPLYYVWDFRYVIPDINNNDNKVVSQVEKEYIPKLWDISLELLIINILKDLISNREMETYLIKVDNVLNKKQNLLKKLDSKYINQYVKILIPFKEMASYSELDKFARELGINALYEYDGAASISEFTFINGMEVIVNEEFIKNNLENQVVWEKNKIKLVVKNKED